MLYGVQYYPEHWPRERWSIDATMMQQAGVTTIRMGEFAWSAYEPVEGTVDFSWMDEAIATFAQHGIRTIMCTCSRTPPPWAYAAYPSIANTWRDGSTSTCDSRYGVGLAHQEFVDLAQRIDRQVISHFAGNDHIVAWQVDNEVGSGNDCYCSQCHADFQQYLRRKYSSTEALNDAWGRHVWSLNFSSFDEIPLPKQHPQLKLEYRRFMSEINVNFAEWRTQLIHQVDPGKPVTTNFQAIKATHTDYHELAKVIDVNGMNHYPSRTPELAIDYNRGARGTLWALEQHTRLGNMDTPAGRMRLWAWMTIAHGADAIIYFRWRQSLSGNETFSDGLLPHSGEPNRRYAELVRMGRELQDIGTLIDHTQPRASAAIVYSFESRWAVETARINQALDPAKEATDYHKALSRQVSAIDALNPRDDLSAYTLVIAPRLWMVDEAIAINLKSYVANGGTLCLTTGTGMVDEHGTAFTTSRPGLMDDLTGLTVSDLAYQDDLQLPLTCSFVPEHTPEQPSLHGFNAADEINLNGADPIATHLGGWRAGSPAITLHRYGQGQVVYVGARLDQPSTQQLVNWLCDISHTPTRLVPPDGMSVYERSHQEHRLLFIINWNDNEATYQPGTGWRDAFTRQPLDTAVVPPNDVRILITDTQPSRPTC